MIPRALRAAGPPAPGGRACAGRLAGSTPSRGLTYTPRILEFRFIAIEGPPGVGKTALAERLAVRLDAASALEETENPFLADFYAGRRGAAFQTQLFFVLSRHRQHAALRQADLFTQVTICDYLFEKDKIYAYLNLDDNELFVYQHLYDLLARDISVPDLVVYLQAPPEMLLRRLRERARDPDLPAPLPEPPYVQALTEAYHHFFFHYSATPLLVVETSHLDLAGSNEAVDDLVRQIRGMGRVTRYYVPRTSR